MTLFGIDKEKKAKTNEAFAYYVVAVEQVTNLLLKKYKIKNTSLIKFEVAAFLVYYLFNRLQESYETDYALLLTLIHDHILTIGHYILDSLDARIIVYGEILHKSRENIYTREFRTEYDEYEYLTKPLYSKFFGLIERAISFDKRLTFMNGEFENYTGEWDNFIKIKKIEDINALENSIFLLKCMGEIEDIISKMLHKTINPFEVEWQYKWRGESGDGNSTHKAY
jgi:hypothetical protein